MTKSIGFLLTAAGLMSASEAQAQHIFHRGASPHRVATSTIYPTQYSTAPAATPTGYAGSGYNDFRFSGRPYGHPYDPWTWPYMSGAYGQGLARYYDPPVK